MVQGVSTAAMQGSSEAGGYTIGVLANDLLKISVNRQNRQGLQEGRLVLVSPFYPEAGFNAGTAWGAINTSTPCLTGLWLLIQRVAVVVREGALENLAQQWVPLFVRTPGNGPGNAALVER